jgi:Berberine and berberine like
VCARGLRTTKYERLRALKRKCDPTNFFCHVGEDMIDEMRRPLGHPAPTTSRHPHRRKSRNSCSTNRGSPSPSRSDAACARKVSKWSRTILYRMVDVGSRGSYAFEASATRRPQAARVPTHRTGQSGVDRHDRVRRTRDADNRGCHRVQIGSGQRRYLRPTFQRDCSIQPGRRSVQLALPVSHDGSRTSSLGAGSIAAGGKRRSHVSAFGRGSEFRERSACSKCRKMGKTGRRVNQRTRAQRDVGRDGRR